MNKLFSKNHYVISIFIILRLLVQPMTTNKHTPKQGHKRKKEHVLTYTNNEIS